MNVAMAITSSTTPLSNMRRNGRPNSGPQTGSPPRAYASRTSERASLIWPLLAIALVLALQCHLVLTRSINWDEFHFLKQVHSFARGELTSPLQTFHVRLFAWLPALDMAGVDQIRMARIFMLGCEIVTCAAIVAIARRFVSLPNAALAALAFLSVSYVFQHGWSFRTDPMATALSMSALAVLARSRLSFPSIIAIALMLGTAFMITIKIVLYAPAFAGFAWLRWTEAGRTFKSLFAIAAGPALAIGVAALLYLWHSSGLAPSEATAGVVERSGSTVFVAGNSPYLRFYAIAAMQSVPFVLALLLLPFAMSRDPALTSTQKLAIVGLVAMVLTPFYYLNAFPYFYAFMLAPVAAAMAVPLAAIAQRYSAALVAAVLAGWAVMLWMNEEPSELDKQRTIQIAANQMFDAPVNYFDFPGFLPEHRKANHFMTAWGIKDYIEGRESSFTQILSEETVPLLAAVDPEKNPSLLSVMTGIERQYPFFEEDQITLLETYRQVWGPLYVAGVELAGGETREWRVHVPGTYRVEAPISVDGQGYVGGETVNLKRGTITLEAEGDVPTGLLWSEMKRVPDLSVPERPYWTDF